MKDASPTWSGSPLREGKCRGCGAPILWAFNSTTDRRIPLDAKPTKHVYRVVRDGIVEPVDAYESHFRTCPAADAFSGGDG